MKTWKHGLYPKSNMKTWKHRIYPKRYSNGVQSKCKKIF